MNTHTKNSYKAQAEKIAIECFLDFDTETQKRFWEFLPTISPAHQEMGQFLQDEFENLKAGNKLLSKYHKRTLLGVILPFLLREKQFYLLVCEILDSLQTPTYQQKYPINLQEFIDIIQKNSITIQKFMLQETHWFHEKVARFIQREAILATLRYLYARKMYDSLEFLKKDWAHLQNQPKLPRPLRYYFTFMEVEIILPAHIKIRKLPVLPIIDLPTLEGKFASLCQNYLAEELSAWEKKCAEKEFQASLLVKDLPTTLAHFKGNILPTNRVEADITLQGGGGIVRLELKRNRWKSMEKSVYIGLSLASLLVLAIAGLGWKSAIFPLLMVLVFLLDKGTRQAKNLKERYDLANNKEKELAKIEFEKYKEAIEINREEMQYVYKRTHILDKIKDAIYWKIKNANIRLYIDDVDYDPLDMLNLYKKYATYIKNLQPQHIEALQKWEGTDFEKKHYLNTVKHLFILKLENSYAYFTNFVKIMIDRTLRFKYMVYFLDKECEIIEDHLVGFYAQVDETNETDRIRKYNKTLREIYNNQLFDANKIIELPNYNDELKDWLENEKNSLKKDNWEHKLSILKHQIDLKSPAFCIENVEGVLFYSKKNDFI
jgi:hypothetical protein